jgi:large subunit ribosomal protein L24e
MAKCTTCKDNIYKGTGKMFVRNDGRIFNFCSSKCQKNWKLGRESKKLTWVTKTKKTKKAS